MTRASGPGSLLSVCFGLLAQGCGPGDPGAGTADTTAADATSSTDGETVGVSITATVTGADTTGADETDGSPSTGTSADTGAEPSSSGTASTGTTADDSDSDTGALEPCTGPTAWIGGVTIEDLDDVAALAGYTCVSGGMLVDSGVPSLVGLEGLVYIGGLGVDGPLDGEAQLQDLTGLDGLQHIGGPLFIGPDALALVSLHGLQSVAIIDGDVTIVSLPSLDGLDSLLTIEGDVVLGDRRHEGAILDLGALANLTRIGGDLFNIEGNLMPDLNALANLTDFDGALHIRQNYALVDVTGMSGLTQLQQLHIDDNPMLPDCNAWALAAQVTVQEPPLIGNLPDECTQ